MADAPILGATTKLKLDDAIFGEGLNKSLIHESVRAELNARRRGTAATKTRGLVSGGGAKPWRQKGTGRARAGMASSPLTKFAGRSGNDESSARRRSGRRCRILRVIVLSSSRAS